MHPLAAKLVHKRFGMRRFGEAKNLVPLLFPNDGMPVPRKREPVCSAEFLDPFVIRARALLFN
jgi:hypothetical protein